MADIEWARPFTFANRSEFSWARRPVVLNLIVRRLKIVGCKNHLFLCNFVPDLNLCGGDLNFCLSCLTSTAFFSDSAEINRPPFSVFAHVAVLIPYFSCWGDGGVPGTWCTRVCGGPLWPGLKI